MMNRPAGPIEPKPPTPGPRYGRARVWMIAVSSVVLGGIALLVLGLALLFGEKIATVTVTYVGDEPEVADVGLPFRDENETLPDYKLRIRYKTSGFWFDSDLAESGPVPNLSAGNPIVFRFAADVPTDKIESILLLENDLLEDDLVTACHYTGEQLITSDGYELEIAMERSMRFGFERIWEGEFGATVVAVFVAMAAVLVIGSVEFLFASLVGLVALPFRRS